MTTPEELASKIMREIRNDPEALANFKDWAVGCAEGPVDAAKLEDMPALPPKARRYFYRLVRLLEMQP